MPTTIEAYIWRPIFQACLRIHINSLESRTLHTAVDQDISSHDDLSSSVASNALGLCIAPSEIHALLGNLGKRAQQLSSWQDELKLQLGHLDRVRSDVSSYFDMRGIFTSVKAASAHEMNSLTTILGQQQERKEYLNLLLSQVHGKKVLADYAQQFSADYEKADQLLSSTQHSIMARAQPISAAIEVMDDLATRSAEQTDQVLATAAKDLALLHRVSVSFSQAIAGTVSVFRSDIQNIRSETSRTKGGTSVDASEPQESTGLDVTGRYVVSQWENKYNEKLEEILREAEDTIKLCEADDRFSHVRQKRKYSSVKQLCNLIGPGRQFVRIATLSECTEQRTAADVIYVTEQEALTMLRGHPAKQPLLIEGQLRYPDAFENFLGRLTHRRSVDVQDTWSEPCSRPKCVEGCDAAQAFRENRNPAIRPESRALNLLNLDVDISKYGVASSVITQEPELGLASTIDRRLDRAMIDRPSLGQRQPHSGGQRKECPSLQGGAAVTDSSSGGDRSQRADRVSAGKRTSSANTLRDTSINGCLKFMIAGQRGVFSGPHLDILNGTWIRCLSGVKVWSLLSDLSKEEEVQFERLGDEWAFPAGRARLIILQPGDTLFMPPGLKVIHAPFTLEDCVMAGGMVWDYRNILKTVKNILYIACHPQTTNETMPTQLPEFLSMLQNLVAEQPLEFQSSENGPDFERELSEVILQLKAACSCPHAKVGPGRRKRCVTECKADLRGESCAEFVQKRFCNHVCGCKINFQARDCGVWCVERGGTE